MTTGLHDEYRVRLDAFEGPLDLLLHLIRKHEVDLHDIPIATITDQYLAYTAELLSAGQQRLDMDEAGEFLVMAATLTEVKSRMLLPTPQAREGQADGAAPAQPEDPRAELVRQLLEYKRYRDAADALENRGESWARRLPAGRAGAARVEVPEDQEPSLDMDEVSLLDLVEAFRVIERTVNFERLGDHQVTYDDTPQEIHAQDILLRLSEAGPGGGASAGGTASTGAKEMELVDVLRGRTRSEMVGLFLALLELVRGGKVGLRQDRASGAILLRARDRDAEDQARAQSDSDAGTT